ncbi:MAG: VPA1267 family protein [Burkholderiaceae bacterium]|nr:VPA1267 family protein [Burkholderiaceae bacterium]
MASGQQLAEVNVELFTAWAASKTDADFREMTVRGQLSRTEIAKECGFAKSALAQNPRVKAALAELETHLRERGVLPALAGKGPTTPSERPQREGQGVGATRQDLERLRRLEQENAALRAEVAELKFALERHAVIREALELTGRMPR